MHRVLLPNMPVINIQQGFYTGSNVLPNIEEEWDIYHEEFGLDSFAVYPDGTGQDCPSVMTGETTQGCSIKS